MFKTSTSYSLRLRTFSVWPTGATPTQRPQGAQNSQSQDTVQRPVVWRVERLGPTIAAQSRPREVRVPVPSDIDLHPDWREAA